MGRMRNYRHASAYSFSTSIRINLLSKAKRFNSGKSPFSRSVLQGSGLQVQIDDLQHLICAVNHEQKVLLHSFITIRQKADVKSSIIKRSILLEHQRTSVSLEDAFCNALRDIAAERRETVPH